MDSTVIMRKEDGSADTWACRDIALGEILTQERRSRLGEAYLLWSDFVHPAMALDDAPDAADDRTGGADGSGLALADVFRLDCERRNPFEFRLVVPGRPERSVRLGELAPEPMRRVLAREMSYAKGCRRPLYQHVRQRVDGVSRECFRLLLPVLGSAGQVSQIYGFCRPVADAGPPPRFAPPPSPGA